jgi:hypothetical protein
MILRTFDLESTALAETDMCTTECALRLWSFSKKSAKYRPSRVDTAAQLGCPPRATRSTAFPSSVTDFTGSLEPGRAALHPSNVNRHHSYLVSHQQALHYRHPLPIVSTFAEAYAQLQNHQDYAETHQLQVHVNSEARCTGPWSSHVP